MSVANQVLERIAQVLIAVCSVLFVVAVVALITDILLRWAFNSSISGLHEAIIIVFLYGFMLGTAALYIRRGDVVLTLVSDRLDPRLSRWVERAVQAVVAVSMGLVAFHAVGLTFAWHGMRTPALGIPRSIELLPVAISCLIMALNAAVRMVVAAPPPTNED